MYAEGSRPAPTRRKGVRPLNFVKMHGLGNDYIFFDGLQTAVPPVETVREMARWASRRGKGVGSDGIILILRGDDGSDADFRMRTFNADGSEGEMCGNGIRCLARYVYEAGYTGETTIRVDTPAGVKVIESHIDGGEWQEATVDMGTPALARRDIPMTGEPADEPVVEASLAVEGQEVCITAVSMGNPHAVIFVEDSDTVDPAVLGPHIERHPAFPERTNVEFVAARSADALRMRIWERGSGITMACGTGACASLVAAFLTGRSTREADVVLDGGTLRIRWDETTDHVFMTGPAEIAYTGSFAWPRQDWEEETT